MDQKVLAFFFESGGAEIRDMFLAGSVGIGKAVKQNNGCVG
jgi:hypothetical protein